MPRPVFSILMLWLSALHTKALVPSKISSSVAKKSNNLFFHPKISDNDVRINQLHMATADENVPLSTNELLAQLNARKIRYSPSATRQELEELLETEPGFDGTRASPSLPTDLSTIVQDLLAKGARLPRHASRGDLESLWIEQSQKPKRRRRKHTPIREILRELVELGIDYPPGASPRTLELLLQKYSSSTEHRPVRVAVPTNMDERDANAQIGMAELLDELNRRSIRIPPTAKRQELEQLLQREINVDRVTGESGESSSYETLHSTETTSFEHPTISVEPVSEAEATSTAPSIDQNEKEIEMEPENLVSKETEHRNSKPTESVSEQVKAQRKPQHRAVQRKPKYSPPRSRLNTKAKQSIFSSVSQVAGRAARKARHATRNARDFLAEDENGIRDVDYEYVQKDNVVIDVTSQAEIEEPTTSSSRNPYNVRQSKYPRSRSARQRRSHRPTGARVDPKTARKRRQQSSSQPTAAVSSGNVAAQSSLFRLPPAQLTPKEELTGSSKAPHRRTSSTNYSRRRRIYSPYKEDDAPSQVYRDSFDRLGEFFVNTADTILWGGIDDKELYEKNSKSSQTTKKRAASGKREPCTADCNETNWKDRLEERFDSMLGIHEVGEFYNRWAEQEDSEAEGNDAFSVAQGRAPKNRRRTKSKAFDKPFWEQGNLFAGLFGRAPPDGYRRVGPGNVLPFFRATMKSLISFGKNACEWATVHGSLPQPVVVIGVTGCVLSVRPGKRLMTLAISLFAFRIFGELIHEGLYGQDDWEETDEEEDESDNVKGDGELGYN